jgi:hypothetical protein
MIGDIKQKTGAKAKSFKDKNSEGRSFKTLDGPRKGDGGGGKELKKTAKRATKNGVHPPGPGTKDKQSPGKQQSRQLSTLDLWCQGKKACYK